MAEWGVRLEKPGCPPVEFKCKTGRTGAKTYARETNTNVAAQLRGEKATVITRRTPDDPWEVPEDGAGR